MRNSNGVLVACQGGLTSYFSLAEAYAATETDGAALTMRATPTSHPMSNLERSDAAGRPDAGASWRKPPWMRSSESARTSERLRRGHRLRRGCTADTSKEGVGLEHPPTLRRLRRAM